MHMYSICNPVWYKYNTRITRTFVFSSSLISVKVSGKEWKVIEGGSLNTKEEVLEDGFDRRKRKEEELEGKSYWRLDSIIQNKMKK